MSEIPEGRSERISVEDVAEIRSGNGFPKKYQGRSEGELPFYKVGDISRNWQNGQITLAQAEHYLSRDEAKEIRAKTLPEGSVVFAKIGAAVALNRRAILGTEALVDNNVMALVPTGATTSKFLFYYMCQVDLGAATRGGAVPSLRKGDVGNLELRLPPLPEQRRIVARIEELFSRLDVGVAALRHAKAQLQRYRQSVLAAAVTGQLTREWREQHPGTEPAEQLLERILEQRREQWSGKAKYKEPPEPELEGVPEIPASWQWTTAEALSDQNRAITYGVIKLGKDFEGGVPTLRSSDVRPLRLELDHVKSIDPDIAQNYRRTFLGGGELLVTVRGTLGGICVVPDECSGFNISREVAMIAPVIREIGPCTALMIASQPLQRWMLGRTKGITYRGVNIETLKRLPIPLPPLAEQHQIVAEVEARTTAIDHLEAELERQITRSNRLRQSALAEAFSGRLVGHLHNDQNQEAHA